MKFSPALRVAFYASAVIASFMALSFVLMLPTIIGVPCVLIILARSLRYGKEAYYGRELNPTERRLCWLWAIPLLFIAWAIRDFVTG